MSCSASRRASADRAREAAAAQDVEETAREREQRARRAARGAEREEIVEALDLLAGWYRDVLAAAVGAQGRCVQRRPARSPRSGRPAGSVPQLPAAAAEAVVETRRRFELHVFASLALEALFIELGQALGPHRVARRPRRRPWRQNESHGEAVGVVFSPGGKVYSFDPGSLQLAWNEKVICQTARGKEYGRVVEANHPIPTRRCRTAEARRATRHRCRRRAGSQNRQRGKAGMLAFRDVTRELGIEAKPIAAELVFDGSRLVFTYGERRQDRDAAAFRTSSRGG